MDEDKAWDKKSKDQSENDVLNLSHTWICHSMPNVVYSVGRKTHRRRYLVNFLVIMFGIGSCISLNGVGAELPLLVISAPEGSTLPSHLAMAAVIAYVLPAVYALCNKSTRQLKIRNEFAWISSVLILGTVTMGVFAFFYNVTATINAVDHSVVMIILVFILALVTASRNILLLPYLRHFEELDLPSFFIGEGLSGFIPSIVALIQGIGGEPVCPKNTTNTTDPLAPYVAPPNFSSRHYFLFVFALMVSTTCAFWVLEYLRIQEFSDQKKTKLRHDCISEEERNSSSKLLDHESAVKMIRKIEVTEAADPTTPKPAVTSENSISNNERIYLCVLMAFVCAMAHGYLNNIEVFSSRPYGNAAYHLAVNLSQLAGTMSCVLAFWLPPLGVRGITGITSIACVGATYVTWLALSSPMPLWRGTTHGVVLLVVIWILLIALVSYIKLAVTAIIWQEVSDAGIYQIGFANLAGSIGGATFIFYLVNFTTVLQSYTACEFHE